MGGIACAAKLKLCGPPAAAKLMAMADFGQQIMDGKLHPKEGPLLEALTKLKDAEVAIDAAMAECVESIGLPY